MSKNVSLWFFFRKNTNILLWKERDIIFVFVLIFQLIICCKQLRFSMFSSLFDILSFYFTKKILLTIITESCYVFLNQQNKTSKTRTLKPFWEKNWFFHQLNFRWIKYLVLISFSLNGKYWGKKQKQKQKSSPLDVNRF